MIGHPSIGQGVSGTGSAVVFAHGLGVNRHMWDQQVERLSDRYRCITFDARGHGESPVGERRIGIAEATEDVVTAANACDAKTFALVGASMGARTAIEATLAHPDRVSALVISDITEQSGEAAQARLRGAAELFERGGADAMAALSAGPGAQAFIRAERARDRDPFAGHDLPALGATVRGLTAGRPSLADLAPALRGIAVPVLVVCGSDDYPSREPSRFVAETIPQASLVQIRGAGHLAALYSPGAYANALGQFLDRALDARATLRT